jgi:hypothetical protein
MESHFCRLDELYWTDQATKDLPAASPADGDEQYVGRGDDPNAASSSLAAAAADVEQRGLALRRKCGKGSGHRMVNVGVDRTRRWW